jgi:transcriptional regulator with XRE-family HTH domain
MHKGQILQSLIRERSDFSQRDVATHLEKSEKYFSALLQNGKLKDELIRKACKFIGADFEENFGAGAESEVGVSMNQYLKEKGDWLNEKAELLENIGLLNNQVAELTAELYKLKEQLNLGGLSKVG